MTIKYKMSLDAFEAEHAEIGKHLAAARDSVTESGGYRLPLNYVRDCHRRMGDMIADAYASMAPRNAESASRGGEAEPRGAADRAPTRGVASIYEAFPDMLRLQNRK
jgi:hypothetical protein